ncbi:cysteine hydrolase family protein [Pelagibius sp.]|uniref:cysteine hydrolase family protein n=1 Tax=Pelagibius sp. TaxID=1931238 RepID=UPI00262EB011|nr:cysteine hydrolase family protein [Pelagibius sp.]
MTEANTKTALLVIDLQNDYFPGGKWTCEGIEAATANAARLIAAARAAGDLVVHIRHEFTSSEAPFFAPGTPGAEIHSDVTPAEGATVILKHYVNSFRDTDLKSILEQHGIEEVVICGAMSHLCIDGATRAADDFGYRCTVVHDACASRDLEFNGVRVPAAQVHAAFMAALSAAYAKVVSTDAHLESAAEAA